jgi:hypothetical protein
MVASHCSNSKSASSTTPEASKKTFDGLTDPADIPFE